MRTLNKRQKKLLTEWFNENWTGAGSIYGAGDVPQELYDTLEKINDHETIHQNIERFVSDMATEATCKKADRTFSFNAVKKQPAKFVQSRRIVCRNGMLEVNPDE